MDFDEEFLPDWWSLDEAPPRKSPHPSLQESTWEPALSKAVQEVESIVVNLFLEFEKHGTRTPAHGLAEPLSDGAYILVAGDYRDVIVEASLQTETGPLKRRELTLLEELGFHLNFETKSAQFALTLGKGDPTVGWRLAARVATIAHWHIFRRNEEYAGGNWSLHLLADAADEADSATPLPTIEAVRARAQELYISHGTEVVIISPHPDSGQNTWHASLRTERSFEKFLKLWVETTSPTSDETIRKTEAWFSARKNPSKWDWILWN